MSMDLEQFLMELLAEEAAEIAQRAIKINRFGMHDKQTPEHETNKWRLYNELTDLRVILDFLQSNAIFDFEEMCKEEGGDHYANKWMAVIDWAGYSVKRGKLSGVAYEQLKNPKPRTDVQTSECEVCGKQRAFVVDGECVDCRH